MKRLIALALAAVASLLVGACAAPSAAVPAPTSQAAATAAPAPGPTSQAAPTTAPTVAASEAPAPTVAATEAPATTTAPASGGAAVSSPLAGTAWRVTFLGIQEEPEKAASDLQASVAFGPDGALSGSTGCAQLTGRYTADEAALSVSDLTVTEASCPSAEAEAQAARFVELLGKADGFSVEGVVLEVTAGDSAIWLQPAS